MQSAPFPSPAKSPSLLLLGAIGAYVWVKRRKAASLTVAAGCPFCLSRCSATPPHPRRHARAPYLGITTARECPAAQLLTLFPAFWIVSICAAIATFLGRVLIRLAMPHLIVRTGGQGHHIYDEISVPPLQNGPPI